MDAVSAIKAIDAGTLAGPVRRLLQSDSAQISSWQVQQLEGGAGNPVSAGLFRFTGMADDHGRQTPWSLVLKAIQSPANLGLSNIGEGEDQTHWNFWKRELLVYQSELHRQLTDGLVAPRCFGVSEQPGDRVWLWLEDVQDAYGGSWSLERYALTARHLGRLNGHFAGEQRLPAYAWLSRQTLQQWLTQLPSLYPCFFSGQPDAWAHPLVLRHYPEPDQNAFRRLLLEPEPMLAVLKRLPSTLCHGDAHPANFMSRSTEQGQDVTIALDWAMVGVGPIGDDLGQLMFGACNNLPGIAPQQVEECLFASYLQGLSEGGWSADPLTVRFAASASAVLRVGLFRLWLLDQAIQQQAPASAEASAAPAPPRPAEGAMAPFEVRMAVAVDSLLGLLAQTGR